MHSMIRPTEVRSFLNIAAYQSVTMKLHGTLSGCRMSVSAASKPVFVHTHFRQGNIVPMLLQICNFRAHCQIAHREPIMLAYITVFENHLKVLHSVWNCLAVHQQLGLLEHLQQHLSQVADVPWAAFQTLLATLCRLLPPA